MYFGDVAHSCFLQRGTWLKLRQWYYLITPSPSPGTSPGSETYLRRGVLQLLMLKYKYYGSRYLADRSRPVPTSIKPLLQREEFILVILPCHLEQGERSIGIYRGFRTKDFVTKNKRGKV
ncbi:hypothetical protein A3841_14545 [Pontibacter flavimaris]|uniref:Uncharacterized protein n=1 Tax=Pontibacter flavimaris TaxID=1797110 RepID=A0A1Q5PFS9_9BACT|nr:hypothetical protein A3841_14545 [Pontibacter flavimaris]